MMGRSVAQWRRRERLGQQPADQLPWFHLVTLLTQVDGEPERVWLWSQTELLDALYDVYDKLDPDLRAELPLK